MTLRLRLTAAVFAAATLGVVIGLGVYTFGYAKGYSYLTNDPAACANCHIMTEHYDAWAKGSHHAVATCNDCHTPHDPIGKYTVKARNGFWHSFYFTTGRFPDPLRITPGNHEVTEQACRYCHAEIVEAIDAMPQEQLYPEGPPGIASASPNANATIRAASIASIPGHGGVSLSIAAGKTDSSAGEYTYDRISCVRCHAYVGHWVR